MRKSNIVFVMVSFTLLALFSCQKEYSLETSGITTTTTGGTTGGGTTTTTGSGCKACTYLPTCAGSKYTYSDTSALGSATARNADIISTADTLVGTATYTKVNSNNQISYVRCVNGETHQAVFNISAVGPSGATTIIPKIETIGLKANEPVGATWVDTNSNGLSQTIIYKYSIAEKGIGRTVAGKTYLDVIHVHMITSLVAPLIGNLDTNINDYYFAKSVGLIDYYVADPTTGSLYLHSVLISYFIP